MTEEKYKLCKIIKRYKYLDIILKKSHIEDYMELQYRLSYQIDFNDVQDDHALVIFLEPLQEEFEEYRREIFKSLGTWTGIVSLSLGLLKTLASQFLRLR